MTNSSLSFSLSVSIQVLSLWNKYFPGISEDPRTVRGITVYVVQKQLLCSSLKKSCCLLKKLQIKSKCSIHLCIFLPCCFLGYLFKAIYFLLYGSVYGIPAPNLPRWKFLQASNIGKTLQFFREIIFVQDWICSVLHHFQRHGSKDRGKLVNALRPRK